MKNWVGYPVERELWAAQGSPGGSSAGEAWVKTCSLGPMSPKSSGSLSRGLE